MEKGGDVRKRLISFALPFLLLIASLLACGGSTGSKPVAPGSAPAFSHSWYLTANVNDPNFADLKALGSSDAQHANQAPCTKTAQNLSMTIFASGHPFYHDGVYGVNSHRYYTDGNGNKIFDFWSTDHIRKGMQAYMDAWFATAASCQTLLLGVGLNNTTCMNNPNFDCSTMDFNAAGKAWAEMVNGLNTWASSKTARMVVWGAGDLETSWDGPDPTLAFVKGFTSSVDRDIPLINFGDISSDPRWPDDKVYAMTGGKNIVLLPEVYSSGNLNEWTNLKKKHSDVQFVGVMTECDVADDQISAVINSGDGRGDCDGGKNGPQFNPKRAWEDFHNAEPGEPLYAATNIRFMS